MAIENTTILALMAASITAVVSALERTHAALAPYRGARTDTLDLFVGKVPVAGHFDTGNSGIEPTYGDIPTTDLPHSVAPLPPLTTALARRKALFGCHHG